jgi:SOS-response transcriptional repressor LexA
MLNFWIRVKTKIDEQNTKQSWLAEKTGIIPQTLSQWIKKDRLPDVEAGYRIAKALGVALEELVAEEPPKGMSPAAFSIARDFDRLDSVGQELMIQLANALRGPRRRGVETTPIATEEKDMYADTKTATPEAGEPEPAYPAPVRVQKQPQVDNNVAAIFPVYYIPFYGKVAAGRPIDINVPPDRVVPVPAPVLRGDTTRYFTVEVQGTSMTGAGIMDGDYAVMRRAEEPEDGKVMLVRYGSESTLKRIKLESGRVVLCWEDGSGKTIEVDSSEYEIQGEFVKLMRDLD